MGGVVARLVGLRLHDDGYVSIEWADVEYSLFADTTGGTTRTVEKYSVTVAGDHPFARLPLGSESLIANIERDL